MKILQNLVLGAVTEALEQSRQLAVSRMQAVTSGLGIRPGLLQ